MKKIILYIAASIDQRIAEPNGSVEWLQEFPINEKMSYGYKEFISSIDTIIMGGRTWRELSNMDAMGAYNDKIIYVISHYNWGEKDNITFITEKVLERISSLRNESGGNIWLFGGGELISMLLAANLIDEMRITYLPVILGKGIHLFPEQSRESRWVITYNKAYNNSTLSTIYQKI